MAWVKYARFLFKSFGIIDLGICCVDSGPSDCGKRIVGCFAFGQQYEDSFIRVGTGLWGMKDNSL